jgi:hypothetical protein
MAKQDAANNENNVDNAVKEARESIENAFGKVKSLKDYGDFNELTNIKKIDDIIDLPVLVKGFFLAKGQQGVYAMMHIEDLDHNEMHISCGGQFVVDALKKVKEQNAFPVIAVFYRKGKAILVK